MGVNSPPPSSDQNYSFNVSVIPQLDGNDNSVSFSSSLLDLSTDQSILSSDDAALHSSSSSVEINPFEASWFSQISECEPAQPNLVCNNQIPIITGNRPNKTSSERLSSVCHVIRRKNKCIQALSLPIILSYNMRSIWGKLNCLVADIKEREGEIIFLCEVWEKSESKKHQL